MPKGSSLILKHDPDAPLAGLDSVPDDEEPPVGIIFWSFRIMVALGLAMLGLGLWSLVARVAGWLYDWPRSEEHTSELQSLMRISYAVFCLKKKKKRKQPTLIMYSLQ